MIQCKQYGHMTRFESDVVQALQSAPVHRGRYKISGIYLTFPRVPLNIIE